MQKFALLFLAIVATIVMVFSVSGRRTSGISGGGSTVGASPGTSPSVPTEAEVPLPTGEDTIRIFIALINEHKISEAIAMMDSTLVTSDADKQQYGVIFNSFAAITIQKIGPESFGREDLKEGEERYRVELSIAKKPQSQAELWDEGINTRWITVVKQQDRFMIHDIATGP